MGWRGCATIQRAALRADSERPITFGPITTAHQVSGIGTEAVAQGGYASMKFQLKLLEFHGYRAKVAGCLPDETSSSP